MAWKKVGHFKFLDHISKRLFAVFVLIYQCLKFSRTSERESCRRPVEGGSPLEGNRGG